MFENPVYRATVVYSSQDTGEIRVRIPSLAGVDDTVPISYIGRKAYNGTWDVPEIGSQIVVTSSDPRLYNVYWVQVNPTEPTSLTSVFSAITDTNNNLQTAQSDIQDIQNELQEVQSRLDALFLGIFS